MKETAKIHTNPVPYHWEDSHKLLSTGHVRSLDTGNAAGVDRTVSMEQDQYQTTAEARTIGD